MWRSSSFHGSTPDPITGDSTEIRFGYLVENGYGNRSKDGQLIGNFRMHWLTCTGVRKLVYLATTLALIQHVNNLKIADRVIDREFERALESDLAELAGSHTHSRCF
jgi:hypothetical protein